jgi:hypothetical protein
MELILAILVIFHLALLFRWSLVRRPGCYLFGCGALIVAMLVTGIFGGIAARWAMILSRILVMVAVIVAFGSGVWACYAGPTKLEEVERDVEHTLNEAGVSEKAAPSEGQS